MRYLVFYRINSLGSAALELDSVTQSEWKDAKQVVAEICSNVYAKVSNKLGPMGYLTEKVGSYLIFNYMIMSRVDLHPELMPCEVYKDTKSFLEACRNNANKFSHSLEQLIQIAELEDEWAGNESTGFSSDHICTVFDLMRCMKFVPLVYPTMRDSIQLEIETEDDHYFELEIFSSGKINLFSKKSDSEILKLEDISKYQAILHADRFLGQC